MVDIYLRGHEKKRREKPARADRISGQGALESAASYVAGSASASETSDESGKAFSAAFKALLEWGEASGLIRPDSDFPFLGHHPDEAGHEHEVV